MRQRNDAMTQKDSLSAMMEIRVQIMRHASSEVRLLKCWVMMGSEL